MTSTAHTPDPTHCINCGASISNQFCSVCGQETRLHVASATEFIHEFVGHYVALEGRLWKTLRYLFTRPGFLTAEFIAGRRKRYVEPLRVYLTFSILFFAILKFGGPPLMIFDGVKPGQGDQARSEAVAAQPAALDKPAKARDDDEKMLIELGGKFPALESRAKAFVEKPQADRVRFVTAGFFAYVPYALFLLMPLFAFYLKLLYLGTGRHYGEHLLFALHTNAFTFAALAAMTVSVRLEWGLVTTAIVFWIVVYLPMAMRRVYPGGKLTTGLRWLALLSVHMLSVALAMLAAFVAAILM
jgi:hypothetical protein